MIMMIKGVMVVTDFLRCTVAFFSLFMFLRLSIGTVIYLVDKYQNKDKEC